MMETHPEDHQKSPIISSEIKISNQAIKAPIEPYPRANNPTIKKSSISRSKSPNEVPDLRNHNIPSALKNPIPSNSTAQASVGQNAHSGHTGHSGDQPSKTSPKYENAAEKRQALFASKPKPKRKKVEAPQVKLPPAPKYLPLPCLECKNIKAVCETLGVEKIEEVVKLVQDSKQGKY